MDFVEPLDRYEPEERYARARLREIIREKGHSLSALARLIGRNPAYLHQYVGRGSPRHLDEPDLMKIADDGGIMPPKSTWFEPKLRDGMFCHQIG